MLLTELIDELRRTSVGTERLDQLILDHIRPGWYVCGPESFYSRNVGAVLPGEDVTRIEPLGDDEHRTWRAWLANEWSADGHTEALARRLAVLTWQADQGKDDVAKPESRSLHGQHGGPPLPTPSQEVLAGLSTKHLNVVLDALCERISRLEGLKTRSRFSPGAGAPGDLDGDREFGIRTYGERRCDPPATPNGKRSETTLLDAFDAWNIDARPRVKNLRRVRVSVRRFVEVHQNRPMNAYTKAEVRDFLSMMRRMPQHPPKELVGASMPAILEFMKTNPGLPVVTPNTVRAYLKDLTMIFNFAMEAEMCAQNPASNLRIVDRRVQSEVRLPFDMEDLRFIFQESPLYAGCLSSRQRFRPGSKIIKDAAFWIPLVALFTGARLGELAASEVSDYKQEKGVWYLDINAAAEGRHLKTQSADRRIPIHSELIRIGFLEYLRQCKADGHARVFEKIQGRRDVKSAASWTQSWRIYMNNIGHADPKKVFHSFRHTFKGACRDVGIHEEVHDALTGHRPLFSGRRYGWRISLATLCDAIEKVSYPGLDLSHLYDTAPHERAQRRA